MAQLTQDQVKANIDALTKQGAPRAVIQSYLDSLKKQGAAAPPSLGSKIKNFAANALPVAGSIGGGIAGGFAGAALGIETGPGAIATGYAGAVAGAAVGGAAGEAAKEKLQGNKLSAKNIATQGVVQGGLEAVGGPIASVAGKTLEATAAGFAKMFIPKSMEEAGALQAYKAGTNLMTRVAGVLGYGAKKAPATSASTAFQKGLMGTESMIGVQAKRAQGKMWDKLISPALKQSKVVVDMKEFFTNAVEKIAKEEHDPTRQNVLMNALSSIEEDFKGVGKVSMEQLQKYKEGWAKFVPEKAYKGEPIAGALNDMRRVLASQARDKIYTELGDNVKQAYLDYSNLYGLTELGQKAMAHGIIKPGGTFTGLKRIWETATVPLGTIGGQTIYKVGQGVEFLGPAGVKTLGALLGIPSTPQTPSTAAAPSQPRPPQPTALPMQ